MAANHLIRRGTYIDSEQSPFEDDSHHTSFIFALMILEDNPLQKSALLQKLLGPNQSQHRAQTQVFEIPSIIAGSTMGRALGDTCAKHNFMKESYAISLGLQINRQVTLAVAIGSGKKVVTSGTVQASFRFGSESEVYSLTFHLLPACIHNVILGKGFLKATRTYSSVTNFARRVVRRIIDGVQHRSFLYLGGSAPSFYGRLNDHAEEALADTGAKVLIMDEDYARSLQLPIEDDEDHIVHLQFADGSTAKTSGMTYGVRWEFGLQCNATEHSLDFHILKNAPAKIILSDEFLFETNAFSEYECHLVEEHQEEDPEEYFLVIDIDRRRWPEDTLPDTSNDYEQYTELVRRGEEDDRIADLPEPERVEQRRIELERRSQWDAQQANLASSTPKPPSIQCPNQTACTSNHTAPPKPPIAKRNRWRFRLKRKKTP